MNRRGFLGSIIATVTAAKVAGNSKPAVADLTKPSVLPEETKGNIAYLYQMFSGYGQTASCIVFSSISNLMCPNYIAPWREEMRRYK